MVWGGLVDHAEGYDEGAALARRDAVAVDLGEVELVGQVVAVERDEVTIPAIGHEAIERRVGRDGARVRRVQENLALVGKAAANFETGKRAGEVVGRPEARGLFR